MTIEPYYTSLETRLGNVLFFGGRSHLPYYPSQPPNAGIWTYLKSLNPFLTYPALIAMENHLFDSSQLGSERKGEVLDAGCETGVWRFISRDAG